jgi:CRISPR-associated endoribonuclease Cas6
MRIKINFTKNTETVTFVNQHFINSFIHQSLGYGNKYHDTYSDYIVSDLRGGKINKNKSGLDYPNGGFIIVGSMSLEFLENLIDGFSKIKNDFQMHGMKYKNYDFLPEERLFNGINYFKTLSPILLKEQKYGQLPHFITIEDDDFTEKLTIQTKKRLSKINPNLDFTNFNISLSNNKKYNKRKRVFVKNVQNIASLCQLDIYSNRDVAKYIYEYGLGKSTGSGFGCVYKTENGHLYR